MNDELRAVRRTRPAPVTGWADSADGQAVLDAVLTRIRTEETSPATSPRRRRRMLTVAVGVVLAAGAGGVAVAGGLPFSSSDPSGMCARTLSAEADLSEPPGEFDPREPQKACADGWEQMWGDTGTPRPAHFVACAHPDGGRGGRGGGSVIYPAAQYRDAAAACASIGSRALPVATDPTPSAT